MRHPFPNLIELLVIAAAVLFCAAPAAAQGLTATPASVSFGWVPATFPPQPAPVAIGGATAALSAPATFGPTSHPTLFQTSIGTNTVNIGVNTAVLGTLLNGQYSTTLTVTAGANSVDIPVTLTVGASGSVTVSQTSVTIPVPVGSSTGSAIVNVTSDLGAVSFALSYATFSGGNWLTAVTSSATTPATLTILANPAGLGIGTYLGTVTVTPSTGAPIDITVSMAVGGTGLAVSPNPINLIYVPGQAVPAGTVVSVSGSGATSFSAVVSSSSAWLLVNGSTITTGTVPGQFTVTVDPANLGVGQHSGTIQVTGNDQTTATISVQLTVSTSTGLVLNPASLSFSPGSTSAAVSVSTATAGLTNVSAFSTQNWLSVTPPNAPLPASYTVTADPTGLGQGTHTGSIWFSSTGAVTTQATLNVTLTIGAGGDIVTSVAPSSMTFYHQANAPAGPPLQVLVLRGPSTNNYSLSFTPVSGTTTQWLRFSQTTGVTPGFVVVTADVTNVSAGTHTGRIDVVTGSTIHQVPVTLTVSASPVMLASPGTILIEIPADATTSLQLLNVISSAGSEAELAFEVASSASWLTVSPDLGSTPATLSVRVNPGLLTPGAHLATLMFTAPAASNSAFSVPVIAIKAGASTGLVTPASLTFNGTVGASTLPSQSLSVNPDTATAYTASSNASWLVVSPSSGTAPTTLTVQANPSGQAAGTHTGMITVQAGGVTQNVTVTLNLTGGGVVGTLSLDPAALTFDYQQGGAAPAARNVAVSSVPAGLAYTVTTNAAWIAVSPSSGDAPSSFGVTVSPGALGPGTHTATITVSSANALPVNVTVTLNIRAAPLLVAAETLTFTQRAGGPLPDAQNLDVTSTGTPISFTAAAGGGAWLSVTPTSATTPAVLRVAVNPSGLNVGTYNGTVTLMSAGTGGSSRTVNVRLTVSGPLPTVQRVGNAASYVRGFLAPGEIVVLEGVDMGPEQLVVYERESNRVPTVVGGTRVLFNGVPGPVLYSRTDQVSAIVPFGIAGRADVNVQVEHRGQRSNVINMPVAQAAPGIFTLDASGTGPGAILNQDYSVNTASNPAAPGSVISVYGTGGGQTTPPSIDGAFATAADRTVLQITAEIGGLPARVTYSGAAPFLPAGALQVNVEVPPTLGPGVYAIFIRINNVAGSQPGVQVAVR